MDFVEKINALSESVKKKKSYVKTEEATKTALIIPFISALGYDTANPLEVIPEYTSDVGTKQGEKVDYAIMKDDKPIILFECKSRDVKLGSEHTSQLYRYFSVTQASIGILTNGVTYLFYSDLEKKNVMDIMPFLEFDISNIQEPAIEKIKTFRKGHFKPGEIAENAKEMMYTKEIKKILDKELETPSEAFVVFFAQQVYSGRITQSVRTQFKDITHKAFNQYINEKIKSSFQSFLDKKKETEIVDEQVQEEDEPKDEIVTTEEEIEAFYITRAILLEVLPIERIKIRDYKSYCNVLFDGKVTKPLIRFHFNGKQKYIQLFKEGKNEKAIPIEKLSDIYSYRQPLLDTVKKYDT